MFKIAIDGPAGAGKSTIAKRVAKELCFEYIDTGAMYRAITYKALKLNIDMENESEYSFLNNTELDICNGRFILDGVDVSKEIRSVEVTKNVSTPSKIQFVRDFLVSYQRKISEYKNVVMDGRDIGTVVLKNANLKIYLDASVECRAKRRQEERISANIKQDIDEIKNEIIERDKKDSTRKISPLKKSDDAITIDSSNMTIDDVKNKIIELSYERGLKQMSEKLYIGQEVRGTVNYVSSTQLKVELTTGEDAICYYNELVELDGDKKMKDYYQTGSDFKGLIKQITKDNQTGNDLYHLSTKLYTQREEIKIFDEILEKDEIINAKVVFVERNGVKMSYKGFDVFLPNREVNKKFEELKELKGKTLKVLVTRVNHERMQVTVSNSLAEQKLKEEAKEKALSELVVGQTYEGTVVKTVEFGAFVNLGEVTGLLHKNEISHNRVGNVEKYVKVGDKVEVVLLAVKEGKLSLSIKALSKHPWEKLTDVFFVGKEFDGTVTKVIPAGLIIKLTDEYSGLMPRSEYSHFNNERLDDKYNEGDTIAVKVLEIDNAKKRVLLSHKATIANPWANIKLSKNTKINVEVVSMNDKGAIVKFGEIEGFLPVSEITAEKRINTPAEALSVGDQLEVVVLEFNPSKPQLKVSKKAVETAKERAIFDEYFKEQADTLPSNTLADILGSKAFDFSDEENK